MRLDNGELFNELTKRYGSSPQVFFNLLTRAGFPVTNINNSTANMLFTGFLEECGRLKHEDVIRAFQLLSQECTASDVFRKVAGQADPSPPAFTWLHLSDLHFGLDKTGWLWPYVKERFYEDLDQLCSLCGGFDVVFFTGDHVQKGTRSEYEKLDSMLAELWDHLLQRTPHKRPVLVSVPGNHDLQRPEDCKANALLADLRSSADTYERFWREDKHPHRLLVSQAFHEYESWRDRNLLKPPVVSDSGILPGEFATSLSIGDLSVGIVGINTAFSQLTSGDYEKRLLVHRCQGLVCKPDLYTWNRLNKLRIVISHHPPSWLDSASLSMWENDIAPAGRFHFHLFGHLHSNRAAAVSSGGAPLRRYWQSEALFGLEKFSVGAADEVVRQHGYTAGKLELSNDYIGRFMLWPRVLSRVSGSGWRVGPDAANFVLEPERQCTRPEIIDLGA